MLVISPLPPGGSWASITVLEDGTLRFDSLWDPDLKDALKAQIPATDRRAVYENNKFQYWAVAPQHANLLADLAEKHKMGRPQVPLLPDAFRPPEFDVLDEHMAKWEKDAWDSIDSTPTALLECGHEVGFGKYPIKGWPERLYCPTCKAVMMTDAYRRDYEDRHYLENPAYENDPWDSVGG